MKSGKLFGLTILVLLTVPGVIGLWYRSQTGLMESNLTNHVTWGLWVALYVFFLGLSAGGFALSSLVYVFKVKQLECIARLAVLQAFVCMLVGVALIWIDLGHPLRFFQVLSSPNPTSLLSWEAFAYLIYLLILMGELWILRRIKCPDELPVFRQKLLAVLAACGIPVAIGVHWGTGALFAVVKARPLWNTGITPVAFLASAAVSGTALLMVMAAIFERKDEQFRPTMHFLGKLTGCLLVIDLLLLNSEALVVWYGQLETEYEAYQHYFTGPYWHVCIILHYLIGIFIPLVIFLVPKLRQNSTMLVAGAVCVVVGTLGYRLSIIIPPQLVPSFDALPDANFHDRNTVDYFPSTLEWLSSLGVIMGGIWLFLIGRLILEKPNRVIHTIRR